MRIITMDESHVAAIAQMEKLCFSDPWSENSISYELTNRLIALAEKNGCDYAVDLFYLYGSDAAHAFRAGNNLRPAAFGMGVYCSHGAERTHMKGIENTVRLLVAYLLGA